MEGQSAHVPESNAQGNGLKSWSGGITPARQGRHARTQQQADSPQRTGRLKEARKTAKAKNGMRWDGGCGWERGEEEARREVEGKVRWMMLVVVRGTTKFSLGGGGSWALRCYSGSLKARK